MFISGCVPFTTRKQRRQIFHELKLEFGDHVRIFIKENLITYTAKVPRTHI